MAILIYLFIIRRRKDWGGSGKSTLLTITLLIVPITGLTLWNQMQSKRRLGKLGFAHYNGLGSNVGTLAGTGEHPTWLFTISEPENTVLDFYKQPKNHPGWNLTFEDTGTLIFENADKKLTLHVIDGKAAFMLSSSSERAPN